MKIDRRKIHLRLEGSLTIPADRRSPVPACRSGDTKRSYRLTDDENEVTCNDCQWWTDGNARVVKP